MSQKNICLLGACGSFMAGLAVIAKEKGYLVNGMDKASYPPMSEQLEKAGIKVKVGSFDINALQPDPKPSVIIGNTLSSEEPIVKHIMKTGLEYHSGPSWLAKHILSDRHVIAVSGTHGKTTTSAMLAWILEYANMKPGFLVGGVLTQPDLEVSARLGAAPYFIVEADEYDTAFFDRQPKFMHYHPRTLIINNLEFDHADLFNNLDEIKSHFSKLLDNMPKDSSVICPSWEPHIADLLKKTRAKIRIETVDKIDKAAPSESSKIEKIPSVTSNWRAEITKEDGSAFMLLYRNTLIGTVNWPLLGPKNVGNAILAIAAAHQLGVDPKTCLDAIHKFYGVKRRMQLLGRVNNISIYDDFAHHPTAIAHTLRSIKLGTLFKKRRVIAALEFASFTMRKARHGIDKIAQALQYADVVQCLKPRPLTWDIKELGRLCERPFAAHDSVDDMIQAICETAKSGDIIIIMSSRSFGNLPERLAETLRKKYHENCKIL